MFEPLREWTVFPCKRSVCYFFFLSSLWRVERIPRHFSIQVLLSWSPVLITLTPFTLQQTLASRPCSCLQASYLHNMLLPGSLISSSDFATPTHSSPGSPPMFHPRWKLENNIRTSKIIVLLLKPYFQTTNQAVFSLQWLLFYFCKKSKLLNTLWSSFQGMALFTSPVLFFTMPSHLLKSYTLSFILITYESSSIITCCFLSLSSFMERFSASKFGFDEHHGQFYDLFQDTFIRLFQQPQPRADHHLYWISSWPPHVHLLMICGEGCGGVNSNENDLTRQTDDTRERERIIPWEKLLKNKKGIIKHEGRHCLVKELGVFLL